MPTAARTNNVYTETTAGKILHLPHKGMLLPVKLDIRRGFRASEIKEPQAPLFRFGRLVFALPGGGELIAD